VIACRRSGFTLVELLVAMFVLALAVAGAVGVIVAAGRSATGAREKLIAEEMARTALADLGYCSQLNMKGCGVPQASPPYSKHDYRKNGNLDDRTYGWLWRTSAYDAAVGAYSVEVWVYRDPDEPSVIWGTAPDSDLKRQQTILYLQTKLENRSP
jgi:prepilin-type N-terminal cleavage/methylation domain-containing protein